MQAFFQKAAFLTRLNLTMVKNRSCRQTQIKSRIKTQIFSSKLLRMFQTQTYLKQANIVV